MTKMLLVLLVVGCAKQTQPPPAKQEGSQFQVRIGGKPDDQPKLTFKIAKVYEKQKADHTDGGDWTFFDANAKGARFTFGFHAKPSKEPFAFGDAYLAVPDRDNGDKLVEELARAFKVTAPPKAKEEALSPMKFGVAILGTNTGRSAAGGYGGAGTWYATKIFPELGDKQAEVYFNFSLTDQAGEFAEKDADYDKELVEILAAALRDGKKK